MVPSAIATGLVLTNPYRVPAVSVSPPQQWVLTDDLAVDTLSDGAVVIVDPHQIIRCLDLRCAATTGHGLPCLGGAPMTSIPGGGEGCSIEAPLSAATVRPDGTVVALLRGKHNDVRLMWCRLTLDYHTGELFLGGCPATGCPDPALHAVNRGQTYNPRTVATAPRAVVAATSHGPVAVRVDPETDLATVIMCEDIACGAHHQLSLTSPPGEPLLATDHAGTAFTVSAGPQGQMGLVRLPREPGTRPTITYLAGRPGADAIAVTMGGDDRPRILLRDRTGIVMVTCAQSYCDS
jgi:hypothetical protein